MQVKHRLVSDEKFGSISSILLVAFSSLIIDM